MLRELEVGVEGGRMVDRDRLGRLLKGEGECGVVLDEL